MKGDYFIFGTVQKSCNTVILVVRVPGYRSREGRHQICLRSSGSGRGPLCHVSTSEELLGRKSSGFGLEILEYSRRDPPRRPGYTPLCAKFATNFADKRQSLRR
jgi:hypothetical protein